jgi:hypothetical protein
MYMGEKFSTKKCGYVEKISSKHLKKSKKSVIINLKWHIMAKNNLSWVARQIADK